MKERRIKKILTHSELADFKDCPQRWEFRYGIGYRAISRRSPSLLFGSALAVFQEHLYKGIDYGHALFLADNIFHKSIAFNKKNMTAKEAESLAETRLLFSNVAANYVRRYWGDDFLTATNPKTGELLVEFEGRVPVYTPGGRASSIYAYQFKTDRVVVDEGETWILETKSRDEITEDTFTRLIFDAQTRNYCFGVQVYLGIPIAGVIYDVVKRKSPAVPSINKNGEVSVQKCDTTLEIFTNTLIEQDTYLTSLSDTERKEKKLAKGIDFEKYTEELERVKNIRWFERRKQRYSEADYKDAQMELYSASLQLHQCEFFYRNESSCDHWAGCSYKALCRGEDPGGLFRIEANRHPELKQSSFHPPMGTPYKIDSSTRRFGIASMLEAVNA